MSRPLLGCLPLVALRKESVDRNIHAQNLCVCIIQSLSARRAWIEISPSGCWRDARRSLSARRAWIEIVKLFRQNYDCFVALRKESVDRNPLNNVTDGGPIVALRKESVDRNLDTVQIVIIVMVALRKESVDRNQ